MHVWGALERTLCCSQRNEFHNSLFKHIIEDFKLICSLNLVCSSKKNYIMLNYCNKIILGPMVRGSKMPTRLQALKYGADLVYTDELIDLSLLMSTRQINGKLIQNKIPIFDDLPQLYIAEMCIFTLEILGTVDYVNKANGYCTFRTSPEEKDRLIFQMGTANAERAVALAKMVQNDVSGIDVNMGCPKPYSTDFGMGSKLLLNVGNAKNILSNLVKNIPLPITCKIRYFEFIISFKIWTGG